MFVLRLDPVLEGLVARRGAVKCAVSADAHVVPLVASWLCGEAVVYAACGAGESAGGQASARGETL